MNQTINFPLPRNWIICFFAIVCYPIIPDPLLKLFPSPPSYYLHIQGIVRLGTYFRTNLDHLENYLVIQDKLDKKMFYLYPSKEWFLPVWKLADMRKNHRSEIVEGLWVKKHYVIEYIFFHSCQKINWHMIINSFFLPKG